MSQVSEVVNMGVVSANRQRSLPMSAKAAESATRSRSLATAAEIAEFLGGDFSEKTLANWRSQGKGPKYIKLSGGRGGCVRYRWADVNAWLDEKIRGAA